MRFGPVFVSAAAMCSVSAEERSPRRHHNSPPVRLWPLLEAQDYGQPPTRETGALGPALKWKSGPEGKRFRLVPFVWFASRPDDHYLFVVPVYGQKRGAGDHVRLMFPLISTVEGHADLEPYAFVPHLTSFVNTEQQRTLRVLGPLLKIGKGSPRSESPYTIADVVSTGWLLKGVEARRNDAGLDLNILSALSCDWPKKAPRAGTHIVGPSLFSLPLCAHRSTAGRSESYFFPVFWRWRSDTGRYLHVVPLFSAKEEGKHRRSWQALARLLSSKHTKDEDRFAIADLSVVAKLAEHRKGEHGTSLSLLRFLKAEDKMTGPAPGKSMDALSVLGLPFAAHRTDELCSRSHIFPVFWRGRSDTGRYLHLVPLFSTKAEGEHHRSWQALARLLSSKYTEDEDRFAIADLSVVGKLAEYRKGEHGTSLSLLRFLKAEDKMTGPMVGTSTDALSVFGQPLAAHRTDDDSSRSHVFPLFWRGRDQKGAYTHLWPLYGFRRKGEHDRRYSIAWPLFICRRHDARDRLLVGFPCMLAGHSHWSNSSANWLFPLALSIKEGQDYLRAIAPFYLDSKRHNRRHRHILPLFNSYDDGKGYRRRFVLANLLGHARKEGEWEEHSLLWPTAVRRKYRDGVHSHFLPLWWHTRTPEGGLDVVCPALFFRRHDCRRTWTVAFPFYWHVRGRAPKSDRALVIFPLLWDSSSHERQVRRSVGFPVWWHFRDGRKQTQSTTVFPLWWASRDDREQRRSSVAFPLWWHFRDDRAQTASTTVLPVWWTSRNDAKQTRSRVAFPIWWDFRDERACSRSTAVLPLWWSARNDSEQTRASVVFPLWWDSQNDRETARRTTVFPIWWSSRNGREQTRSRVVFPVWWDSQNDRERTRTTTVFPIWWDSRNGRERTRSRAVFPVWWHSRNDHEKARTTTIFPIWWDSRNDREQTRSRAVFPVWWRSQNDRENARTTAVFPLWWDSRNGSKQTRSRAVFPVWWDSQNDREKTRRTTVFPIWRDSRNDNKQTRSRVLFPLCWDSRDDLRQRRNTIVLPFWWSSRDAAEQTRSSMLFPLYWQSRNDAEDASTTGILPVFWASRNGAEQTRSRVLFPLWRSSRNDLLQTRSTTLFPLWWHSCNKPQQTGSRVLFPLWWDFRDDRAQTRRTALLPLAWHFRDRARAVREIALFPTFRWHRSPDVRSWSLWPLVSRKRSAEERSTSVAWPFFVFTRSLKTGRKQAWFPFPLAGRVTEPAGKYSHFRLLPFWSTSRWQDRVATLFPLAWWRRHGEFRGSAWFWYLGKPRDKELTRRHVVLWKLLTYEKRRDGHHDFRFLHKLVHSQSAEGYSCFAVNPLVCRENDAGLYRFSVLGPTLQYEREQGKKRLRLLHFFSIPLP